MRTFVGMASKKADFDFAATAYFENKVSASIEQNLAAAGLNGRVATFAPLGRGLFVFSIRENACGASQHVIQNSVWNACKNDVAQLVELAEKPVETHGEIENFFTKPIATRPADLAAQAKIPSIYFGRWKPGSYTSGKPADKKEGYKSDPVHASADETLSIAAPAYTVA